MASPLSLDVRYLFGEFQCLSVDDCPAASCDSGVLNRSAQEELQFCLTEGGQISLQVLWGSEKAGFDVRW